MKKPKRTGKAPDIGRMEVIVETQLVHPVLAEAVNKLLTARATHTAPAAPKLKAVGGTKK